MSLYLKVKFRAFFITFAEFERLIPLTPYILTAISRTIGLEIREIPQILDKPVKLFDDRGVYLELR